MSRGASGAPSKGGRAPGAKGSAKGGGKSNGQTTTLPPIAGATKVKAAAAATAEEPVHENDLYNVYGVDGHKREESPEPKTRWGKFRKRARRWWRDKVVGSKAVTGAKEGMEDRR